MKYTVISSAAALLLLAACGTSPDKDGAATSDAAQQAAAGPVPGTAADFIANAGDRVFFGFDKHDLTPEAQQALDHQAAWLLTYPETKIVIEGHCDKRGTEKYNMVLGEKRSNAARDYLVALGVPADRVQVISYGKSRTIVEGDTEEAHAQNRVAITVIQ